MRLTLRTLLAYLDDTLEPAQAKLIGQKVAESDTAQELIARIKQVTRRRRLTTPPTGPGSKLEPNSVAEYLDNVLPPDQLAEVEQTCLGSDVHLAEIAACHQILTLVLGEPALIPPTSKQRMYALVKGPEAIPFRRPSGPQEEVEDSGEHNPEADETLRLGLPAYRRGGSWASRLTLFGGALAAALLLALAIWQALRLPEEADTEPRAQATTEPRTTAPVKVLPSLKGTQAAEKPGTPPELPVKANSEKPPAPKVTEPGPQPKAVNPNPPELKKKQPEPVTKPEPSRVPPLPAEIPIDTPSTREREVGKFLVLTADPPSLLLQRKGPEGAWRLLDQKSPEVYTGRQLVSLPGYRSTVQLNSGLRLKLWGNVLEQAAFPAQLRESRVELHAHNDLDLDLTLRRGRIVLENPEKKPLRARVRFDNPTNPQMPETWDITLEEPGTEVLMDRWGWYTRDEPFYPDAKHPGRRGPVADLHLMVLNGVISLRRDSRTELLKAAPPTVVPLVLWNSFKGNADSQTMNAIPKWATTKPDLAPGLEARVRERMTASLKSLAASLSGRPDQIGPALVSELKSPDVEDAVLAVRCFGALDDLPDLIDALADGDRREVRMAAADTLRNWVAAARENDYILYENLRKDNKYLKGQAEIILSLLHNFSVLQAADRTTYELLIDYLNSDKLAIRELAAMHLYGLAGSVGASIPYLATSDAEHRRGSQMLWQKLLDSGKLPPPMGPPAGAAPGM